MEEKFDLIKWIKKHRKALTIAGIGIGAIIALVFGLKNADEIKTLFYSLRKTTEKTAVTASKTPRLTVLTNPVTPVVPVVPVTPAIEEATAALSRQVSGIPFEVSKHLRNLPKGQSASAEKVATAAANGFQLREGQTWVDMFTKGAA